MFAWRWSWLRLRLKQLNAILAHSQGLLERVTQTRSGDTEPAERADSASASPVADVAKGVDDAGDGDDEGEDDGGDESAARVRQFSPRLSKRRRIVVGPYLPRFAAAAAEGLYFGCAAGRIAAVDPTFHPVFSFGDECSLRARVLAAPPVKDVLRHHAPPSVRSHRTKSLVDVRQARLTALPLPTRARSQSAMTPQDWTITRRVVSGPTQPAASHGVAVRRMAAADLPGHPRETAVDRGGGGVVVVDGASPSQVFDSSSIGCGGRADGGGGIVENGPTGIEGPLAAASPARSLGDGEPEAPPPR